MAISFTCPECSARIEIPDEFAGKEGQCPRCKHVFTIPTGQAPAPLPLYLGTPTVPVAPANPWTPEAEPEVDVDEPAPRRPRPRQPAAPPRPTGPFWPWALGACGLVVAGALLLSSLLVLTFWRRPVATPKIHGQAADGPRVLAGRLEGPRAILQNGVFQVRSKLTRDDPPDLDNFGCHAKKFEIELSNDRAYVLEMKSDQLDCNLRVEDMHNQVLRENGRLGGRHARVDFRPLRRDTFLIYVTSLQPGFGPFTLTIREQN